MKSRQRKSRELDRTDRLILKHLQEDGRMSNVALARKVNLSPTPCMERVRRLETKTIPPDFDYAAITGLRNEARLKLDHFRPATIGQASRIAGVNPADISILLVHLEKKSSAR